MTRDEVEKLDFDIDTRQVIVTPDIRRLVKHTLRLMDRVAQLEDQLRTKRSTSPS